MYYIVEIGCVITEVWMIHMFLSGLYLKKSQPLYSILVAYGIFTFGLVGLSFIDNITLVRTLFAMLSIAAIGIFLFQARVLPSLISGAAFCSIFAVTDIITALAFQFVGVKPEILMSNYVYRSFYLVASHIFMFGIVMIICLITRNAQKQFSLKILLPVAPCWIISILLCFVLSWQCFTMDYELHPAFVFVLLGLLYTSIIVIYYIKQIQTQEQEKKERAIAEHHYAMQQEYYDQLRIQQEETRALWHDISKYLRASQIEESKGALVQLQDMLDSIRCVVDVNNRVISVILNEYVQIASSASISLDMDVQVPEVLAVTAADLYILIGNTLDNAIEACQELPVGSRTISLKLKMHNNILFYEISNPYSQAHLHRVRNRYHGFGLKNVTKCVEKYSGNLSTSSSDGIFTVSVHLNSL